MANGDLSLGAIREAIAREGATWEAGENPIWQLPPEEQMQRLGLSPPPGEPGIAEMLRISPPPQSALPPGAPSVFDLRSIGGKNYITAIRDQKSCGSCVAFGCLATIEGSMSWQQQKPNPATDLSEAHLYYCYGAKEGVSCSTGWWPEKAFVHCVSGGVVDEACYPYSPGDQPCNLCADWQKRLTKIKSTKVLTGNVASMKTWISSKGPIVGCFIVFQDFFGYKSGVYSHVSGQQVGGHCISIVGYDDGKGCWICKNSWGPAWGEQGFFRIAYGQCAMESWRVIGVET